MTKVSSTGPKKDTSKSDTPIAKDTVIKVLVLMLELRQKATPKVHQGDTVCKCRYSHS